MSRWRTGLVTGLLFPCPAPSYTINSFPGELIWVPKGPVLDRGGEDGSCTVDGPPGCETVPCLFLPYESARFILIFFHSNAEDLGRCRWFCHFLRDQFQVHVLAVEYPGYGVCPGNASREGVVANAHAALQFVTQALKLPLDQVKLFGRSIGTGPALHLAAKFKVAGLVLVTPFTSIKSLFQDRVGPFAVLVDEWFQNDKAILEVQSPTMIVHGKKDMIVPWQHGESLYKDCPTRKIFINPAGMEHNTNLTIDISFLIVPMFRFFALPDYSFQPLTVPNWAFDKRRSALYVRPEIEVCSHAHVGAGAGKSMPIVSLPLGDDEDGAPVDQAEDPADLTLEELKLLQGRAKSSVGDTPVVDHEKAQVLTNTTVLHTYRATKKQYDFCGGESPLFSPGKPSGPSEDMPVGMLQQLQRKPLGDHLSASRPPANGNHARGRPLAPNINGALVSSLIVPPCSLDMRGASRGSAALAIGPQWAFSRENLGRAAFAKVRAAPFARLEDPPFMAIVRKEKTDPPQAGAIPGSSRPPAFLHSRHSFSAGESSQERILRHSLSGSAFPPDVKAVTPNDELIGVSDASET